jgi:hypothetical protein
VTNKTNAQITYTDTQKKFIATRWRLSRIYTLFGCGEQNGEKSNSETENGKKEKGEKE